jgi:hypothetical protein
MIAVSRGAHRRGPPPTRSKVDEAAVSAMTFPGTEKNQPATRKANSMSAEGMTGNAPYDADGDEPKVGQPTGDEGLGAAYPEEPVQDAKQAVEAAGYEVKEAFGE